jgi:hypothetical protein
MSAFLQLPLRIHSGSGSMEDIMIKRISENAANTKIPVRLKSFGLKEDDLEDLVLAGSRQQRLLVNSVCPQSRCANCVCGFADRPCSFSPKGCENTIFREVADLRSESIMCLHYGQTLNNMKDMHLNDIRDIYRNPI